MSFTQGLFRTRTLVHLRRFSRLLSQYLPPNASWLFWSVIIGIVAGLGAVCFDWALHETIDFLLQGGVLQLARGEEAVVLDQDASLSGWWIVGIVTLGGLISGLIVFTLAPEAEGHGTDAMIESFHLRGGHVRGRAPFVKFVASAITIGSGGSAGKEGPIAQIGSGFGSFLGRSLNLKPKDRRIMLLAGAAGGIGAIFQAPLGAALFVPGVLYQDMDYESEALLPCILSAIVAHSIFSEFYGRHAIFDPGQLSFSMPHELPAYILFGIVCGLIGHLYVRFFYGVRDHFFKKIPIPNIFKPAIGAFLMGLVALVYPHVVGAGYGFVQQAMNGELMWQTMAIYIFAKIVATTFTISSGGSGGVFGPSLFIGAMIGGAFGTLGHAIAPDLVVNPASFVLVGMGGFFAGVAKVPVASVIMACEMSSSYTLLVPLMLVSTVAYLIMGSRTLYEKQYRDKLTSPAHMNEYAEGILSMMRVEEAIGQHTVQTLAESLPFKEVLRLVTSSKEHYFPVINAQGRISGMITIGDIRKHMFETTEPEDLTAGDIATPTVVRVSPGETLGQALHKMTVIGVNALPVVSNEDETHILSMLTKEDLITYYYNRVSAQKLPAPVT